ncbi:prolyl oligopeptidase family serine peptidase [uncultured Proteiniphilum sp.]|uniref:S9 family peptidase n=1 Tax=uncultured Proteiniphilum sp. TaxID=497637 RepID=UPI0026249E40|nr:prolyl oligopeptidase family serine peptidase [uncultured Proteiniphilum sp.]
MKLFILLFLGLLLLAGRDLNAQNNQEELQRLADRHYKMLNLKMSDDGRWFLFRKWHNRNRDTILILNSHYTGKVIGRRAIMGEPFFPDNNHLLTRNRQSAELWNLQKQTGIYYEHVKDMKTLKGNEFVLHYNEKADNKIGLYDTSGKLLQSVDHTTKFMIAEDDCVYVIIKEKEEDYHLVRLSDKGQEQLYGSPREIKYLDIYPGQQGIIIHEQNPESATMSTNYLDMNTKTVYPLQDVLFINPQRVLTEIIEEGRAYFLKVMTDSNKTDSSVVDIWYGNDYQLEKKFYPHPHFSYYVWEPGLKRMEQIGADQSTEKVSLGNERYFLSFDRYLLKDYLTFSAPLKIDIYDHVKDCYSLVDTIPRNLHPSPDGRYLLYLKDGNWYVYHVSTGMKQNIDGDGLGAPYFTPDGESAFFDGDGGWWSYTMEENRLSKLDDFEGYKVTILNGTSKNIADRIGRKTIDPEKPMLLRLYDPNENKTAYILHQKGRNETLVPFTDMDIQGLNYNGKYTHFSYTEEQYSIPPRLVHKEPGKEKSVVFRSNKTDTAILSLKREIVSYANSENIPLKGILYYPLDYNPTGKYPMVVHIYQVQSNRLNYYPASTYGSTNFTGFDLRLLLEKGYFVYFPDIVYGSEGTGLSALDCVHRGLDALEDNRHIDKSRIGLIGHSHGGYQTNFIATHSDRFATYVSGAGNSDIVRSYFSYNYNFLIPFYFQFETGQYEMKKSFSEDKQLYLKNNPIHYVDQVNAPVLLWTGMKDQNIYWEQTMEFYIGLKRNRKKVISLFYPNEGHTIMDSRASKDLYVRILDWFDYFLKGNKNVEWINNEIKKDAIF